MRAFRIELINTGTELVSGSVLNTNAAWLGQKLWELGLHIQQVSVVPDGAEIVHALTTAAGRADLVVVSGGLGPTSDDVTREALCQVRHLTLQQNETVVAHLQEFFAQRNIPMPECNLKQSLVPHGATVLANPQGTAPGIFLSGSPMFMLLPGPPSEFKPMVEQHLIPLLQQYAPKKQRYLRVLRIFQIGEGAVQQTLDETLHSIPGLGIAYCATSGEVELRLIAETSATLDQAEALVRTLLPQHILYPCDLSLPQAVVKRFTDCDMTLATAESCTGGLIAKMITDVPGASAMLEFGWVTYANRAKQKLLGVSDDLLEQFGAVSTQVVAAMAQGALERSGADFALAVSGVAGPDGGTQEKPVGTVCLAWANKTNGVRTQQLCLRQAQNPYEGRQIFRQTVARYALFELLKDLPTSCH